jgi:hypothetical protein
MTLRTHGFIPCSVVVVGAAYFLQQFPTAAKAHSAALVALAPALLPTTAWPPAVAVVVATTVSTVAMALPVV